MAWNRKSVLAAIGTDGNIDAAVVEKAVYTVWLGQTSDEQQTADVKWLNRKGFATKTRFYGTQIGRYLQAAVERCGDKSRVMWGKVIYSTRLQTEAVKIARFHAAQIARAWNALNEAKKAA
jgi:hypothetical protein